MAKMMLIENQTERQPALVQLRCRKDFLTKLNKFRQRSDRETQTDSAADPETVT